MSQQPSPPKCCSSAPYADCFCCDRLVRVSSLVGVTDSHSGRFLGTTLDGGCWWLEVKVGSWGSGVQSPCHPRAGVGPLVSDTWSWGIWLQDSVFLELLPAGQRAGLKPGVFQVPYWPSVGRAVSQNIWLQSPKSPTVEVSPLEGDGVQSLSHVQLFLIPWDFSLPGSSVQGIFQVRILEWVAISSSRGSSWPRDQTCVSYVAGKFFTLWATWKT